MRVTTKIFISFLMLAFLPAVCLSQSQEPFGTVSGRIVNITGVPIYNAEIIFESLFEYKKIKTDSNGNFSVQLHPTEYRINVAAWVGKLNYSESEAFFHQKCLPYFRDSRRANFQLKKNQSLEINFVLPEAECIAEEDGDKKEIDYGIFGNPSDGVREPRVRFETLFYPKYEFENNLDLVIQFGERQTTDKKIIYKPATGYRVFTDDSPQSAINHQSPGIVITYNNYTFYVEEAEYTLKTKQLTVMKGKILVEDGTKKYEIKKLTVKINRDKIDIVMS